MNESELSIQSTYFFLSKIGARVRMMFFPQSADELYDMCDIVITANKEVVEGAPSGVPISAGGQMISPRLERSAPIRTHMQSSNTMRLQIRIM